MATLVSIIAAALITTLLGFIGNAVEILYNYIMSDPLMNFTEILTFIPHLLFQDKTGDEAFATFYSIFAVVAIAIVITIVILSVIKSMFMPAVGKESDSPLQIVIRGFVATAAISVYSTLIKILVDDLMIPLAQTEFFTLQLPTGTVGSGWTWNGLFEAAGLLNVICYVAILVALIMASITHLERMLSFALYLLLGPICLAFYPASESKSVASDWLKGVISQTFGIFISLFAMNLVGKGLVACSNDFTTFNLMVVIALLGFVKNSEKFVNMLGFKTMPNSDTVRGIMTGMGAAMVGARLAGSGVMATKKGIESASSVYDKFKNSDMAHTSKSARSYQEKYLNGATLNNQSGSVNNLNNVGKKFADVQIANTSFGSDNKLEKMSKEEFGKVYDKMTIDSNGTFAEKAAQKFGNKGRKAEAYKQYSERIDQAVEARKNIDPTNNSISASDYEAAVGMTAFNKQMVPGSDLTAVTVSDADGKNIMPGFIGETITENPHNASLNKADHELLMSNSADAAKISGNYVNITDSGEGKEQRSFKGIAGQSLSSYGESGSVVLPPTPGNDFVGAPKVPGIETEGNVSVLPVSQEGMNRVLQSQGLSNADFGSKVTNIEYSDGAKVSLPTDQIDKVTIVRPEVNAELTAMANTPPKANPFEKTKK